MSVAGENRELTQEKQTLLALRSLRRRVEELERAQTEPIAVIGMGCRLPGGVSDGAEYWNLLTEKRNAVREIPPQRLDIDSIFDSRPQTPGKTYSRWAGLLENPDEFDAEFFGISPREAQLMDPQQRHLLEVSWEALENAGINPAKLSGDDVGVFVGISVSEYALLCQNLLAPEDLAAHMIQGSALNAAAGRLSYFYGFTGPSMAIDTACSSSLVAVDRAVRSLQQRETKLAIAGGVNLIAKPEMLIIGSQWGMLSPEGECRAFDAGADGFVRGEGCGLVVLKRLSAAERDGDRILGVILGSAVNQDGASSGLTVPNGLAQQAVIRRALERSGVEPWQVGYVEAHGTGTALGDPIEAEALGAVFGDGKREGPLLIGSVKTNVGHLESAAGVAGLIKVVLGLGEGKVAAQLHWERPSEHVRWSELGLEVVTKEREWERIGGRRIGGVSSFGFSGTNAHVVVEGWDEKEVAGGGEREAEVLVLTARTEGGLRDLCVRYAEYLAVSDARWCDICHTAAVGRGVFGERLAVVAGTKEEASAQLRGWLGGRVEAGVHVGRVRAGSRVRVGLFAAGAERALEWDRRLREWGIEPVPAGATLAVTAGGVKTELPAIAAGEDFRSHAGVLAELFVRGAAIAWPGWEGSAARRRVALPTYAFQRERYWVTGSRAGEEALLPGRRLRAAGVLGQYELELDGEAGWVSGHRVEGRPVLPATGHLELMRTAGAAALGSLVEVEDALLQSPLVVGVRRRVQTVLEEAAEDGRHRVRVYGEPAAEEQRWELVSEGWVRKAEEAAGEDLKIEATRERLGERLDVEEFYAEMERHGMGLDGRFRGLRELWWGPDEALGRIGSLAGEQDHGMTPWRLDACLQMVGAKVLREERGGLYLPMSVSRYRLFTNPSTAGCWSLVRARRTDSSTFTADLLVANEDGQPIALLDNVQFRRYKGKSSGSIYSIDWSPVKESESEGKDFAGRWLVLSDDRSMAAELTALIEKENGVCTTLDLADFSGESAWKEPEKIARELRELVNEVSPLAGVIHLLVAAPTLEDVDKLKASPAVLPGYDSALALLQALIREQIEPRLGVWFVTKDAEEAGVPSKSHSAGGRAVRALRRTAAEEFAELRSHAIDLDGAASAAELIAAMRMRSEPEVAIRNGIVLKPRLAQRRANEEAAPESNESLQAASTGLISDLEYLGVQRKAPRDHEIEIRILAQGLNFRDVMNALGMLPGHSQQLGGECAGIVERAAMHSGFQPGDRVFAFAPGSFSKFVTVSARNARALPAGYEPAQAAGLPVAYLTAIYGFDRLAHIGPGTKILIHAATGGLGLAAVFLASARGAEVYTTAGSEEKRDWLRARGIKHVFNSRAVEFADQVMRATEGRGVDVVLNSLTGELAKSTLNVLTENGCFLEAGKRDVLTGDQVRSLRPDVKHIQFDLGEAAERDPALISGLLDELVRMLDDAVLPALPITEFADVREGFRFMAQARHIGKIVVRQAPTATRDRRIAIAPEATYLITGGCGALGLQFAQWLVRAGARHLVLVSRHGPEEEAEKVVAKLHDAGIDVRIEEADVSDRDAIDTVIRGIAASAPLKGVLHAAGVVEDHGLLQQDAASFASVAAPKWQGAWNLHGATHKLPLDFFVLFSSASVLLGIPGQANYVAANAALDSLAEYRRAQNLPALSVQWGPWSEGMATSTRNDPADFGLGWIIPDDGTSTLGKLLAMGLATATVLPVLSWPTFFRQRCEATAPLFEGFRERASVAADLVAADKAGHASPFIEQLERVLPVDRRSLLLDHLRMHAAKILELPSGAGIDEETALHDVGLDSLMAVELRNALQVSLRRQLSATLLLDYPTLGTLTDFLTKELFGSETPAAETVRDLAFDGSWDRHVEEVGSLTENEAESLLAEELEKLHGSKK